MERWAIKPSFLFVLASVLLAIAVVLVLPQVDLPDTAFHQGTAPIVVHSQSIPVPSFLSVSAAPQVRQAARASELRREHSLSAPHTIASFLPLLHRSFRC